VYSLTGSKSFDKTTNQKEDKIRKFDNATMANNVFPNMKFLLLIDLLKLVHFGYIEFLPQALEFNSYKREYVVVSSLCNVLAKM
jgi:hypothetical protein